MTNPRLALVTVDQGFEYQQNVSQLLIPVVIMIAVRTRLQELQPLVAEVVSVLSNDPKCGIHRVAARGIGGQSGR
ncbi:hypothetical protein [Candidatus Palauibacter sp.]|uniref:hypothetical protein n=1 Tax=Candidatus Palauibacter sp. TaxID=3101350 RepID=UPI003B02397D